MELSVSSVIVTPEINRIEEGEFQGLSNCQNTSLYKSQAKILWWVTYLCAVEPSWPIAKVSRNLVGLLDQWVELLHKDESVNVVVSDRELIVFHGSVFDSLASLTDKILPNIIVSRSTMKSMS